jgi:Zn-dependent M28 family amino/carboxypeptidase
VSTFRNRGQWLGVLTVFWLAGCAGPQGAFGGAPPVAPPVKRPLDGFERALQGTVDALAGRIGPRNVRRPAALDEAARFIEAQLVAVGLTVERQSFVTGAGEPTANLIATIPGGGTAEEIVIVGAHYDTADATPGADDNASGVAATLALARAATRAAPQRTLRFVFFTNEEPPHFQTDDMGSVVYAKACKAKGETITAVLSIDGVGVYSEAPSEASSPWPFRMYYPGKGRYLTFVANPPSRELVDRALDAFRREGALAAEASVLSDWVDGVSWSDQWAFWKQGYPAIMVTDSAAFRSPTYHLEQDTPEKLDYERLGRAVRGLAGVIDELAGASLGLGDPDTAWRRAKLKEMEPPPPP